MEFEGKEAIYLQIAERLCDEILARVWQSGERLPSVRELAVRIEVNPNTVVRSFSHLEQLRVIFKERGIGYFVSKDAIARILGRRKQEFIAHQAPAFFTSMEQLGLNLEDLIPLYEKYKLETRKIT